MIKISRINGEQLVINCELIETVEETPDTIITLSNGKKFVTKDTVNDIIEKVIEYKKNIFINKD